jgi:hypothetical protein
MIVFLPVNRYIVRYEVASGRPYSKFERLLLEAIQQGTRKIDELVKLTRMHRRVVVEGLVSLMHAGWVALRSGEEDSVFITTPAGREALKEQESLPAGLVVDSRVAACVMERVYGQLARGADVFLHKTRDLKDKKGGKASLWERGLPLPSLFPSNVLEPGRVRPLLHVRPGENEYVRRINSVDPTDQGSFFLMIEVDTEKEEIHGPYPSSWEDFLRGELVDRARARERNLRQENLRIDDQELRDVFSEIDLVRRESLDRSDSWEVTVKDTDFVIGGAANRNALQDRIRRARSSVVISSSALSADRIQAIAPHLKAALNRGVRVDILWGGLADVGTKSSQPGPLGLLKELEREVQASGGRLMVSSRPTRSNACVLLSDPDGKFEVLVGSFDWLSADGSTDALDLSVRISHPGPVSRLCLLLNDLIASDERLITSANSTGLKNASAELEKQMTQDKPASEETQNTSNLRLVNDLSHSKLFQDAVAGSRERITLFSRSCDDRVVTSSLSGALLLALERWSVKVDVVYGSGPEVVGSSFEELLKHGAQVQKKAKHHANTLIIDDNFCMVSSFQWLATSSPQHRPSEYELGVCLKGGQIGRRLRDALSAYETQAVHATLLPK